MNSSKIKNVIIIILLAVNAFLLAANLSDASKRREYALQARDEAQLVLENRGIVVTAGLDVRTLEVCTVTRDLDKEKKKISSLLGEVSVTDQGGNIIFYNGQNGQAVFRGTGGFEMLLEEGSFPMGNDPEGTARAFMKKLGMTPAEKDAQIDVSGNSGTVVLGCAANSTEVINCRVTFTFSAGSLMLVVGTRPLDDVSEQSGAQTLDIPTVLMRFLDIVTDGGRVCSELSGIELCYMQNASASGSGTLTPVWRLTTDTGAFFISGLTGKQETAT